MQSQRLWLIPFLFAVLVAGAWYSGVQSRKGDRELPVYVTGAERMADGEEIYRRGTDAKPFTYPPFAAVPFLPLRHCAPEWQPRLWFGVNFSILLFTLVWLHRWSGGARPGFAAPRVKLLWLLSALIAGRHVLSVLENQSHDLLVMATTCAVAIGWGRDQRSGRVLAGVAAGMGAAIKATPLFFLVLFVIRRAWPTLAVMVATAGLLSWLPDLLWPRDDRSSWLVVWYQVNLRGLNLGGTAEAAGAWNPHSILNQSLSGTLTRLFSAPITTGTFVRTAVGFGDLSPGLLRTLIAAAQLAVVLAIGWGVLRARRLLLRASDRAATLHWLALGECSLIVCGMVLLSPQSSKSHFCVLILPAVFCVDRLLRTRRDPWLLLLAASAMVLGVGTAKGLLGRNFGNLVLGFGAVTWGTVLLLIACIRAMRAPPLQKES